MMPLLEVDCEPLVKYYKPRSTDAAPQSHDLQDLALLVAPRVGRGKKTDHLNTFKLVTCFLSVNNSFVKATYIPCKTK